MLDQARESLETARTGAKSWIGADEIGGHEIGADETAEPNAGVGTTEALLGLGVAIGATLLTRKLLEKSWQQTFDRAPPKNPASREVAWREAIAWGVVSGALVGVARIASRRAASGVYRRVW